jgi:hypothetical protein
MDTRERLQKALPLFAGIETGDRDGLLRALRAAGFTEAAAAEIVEFMPLAFARVLLEDVGVPLPEHYVRRVPGSHEERKHRLADEPIYREAAAAAWEVLQTDEAAFVAVAARSSELQALNRALHAGARLDDFLLSPPAVGAVLSEA